jgi:hypothetical protein
LVACGSFLIFGGLFDDGHDEGRSELACAKAKLEELWDMPLPADLEVVGSIPKPEVVNADWDLRKLGCSAETYLAATLQLRKYTLSSLPILPVLETREVRFRG